MLGCGMMLPSGNQSFCPESGKPVSLSIRYIAMLTGNLVRVRTSRQRIIPLYLNPESPQWLEVAESLWLLEIGRRSRTGIADSRDRGVHR